MIYDAHDLCRHVHTRYTMYIYICIYIIITRNVSTHIYILWCNHTYLMHSPGLWALLIGGPTNCMGLWRGEMSIRLFLNINYLVKLITSGRYAKNRWSISNEWSWLFQFLDPSPRFTKLKSLHIAGPWHWEIPGRPAKNLSAARSAAASPNPNGTCDAEAPSERGRGQCRERWVRSFWTNKATSSLLETEVATLSAEFGRSLDVPNSANTTGHYFFSWDHLRQIMGCGSCPTGDLSGDCYIYH